MNKIQEKIDGLKKYLVDLEQVKNAKGDGKPERYVTWFDMRERKTVEEIRALELELKVQGLANRMIGQDN